jgi:hypothetical protein
MGAMRANAGRRGLTTSRLFDAGSGTAFGAGVALFGAFLKERRAIAAMGPNWLLFGHQCDCLVDRDEFEVMRRERLAHGSIVRLVA